MPEEQDDIQSRSCMADHRSVAWKRSELSAVGRCAWPAYHTGKGILRGKAEEAAGSSESVRSGSDPTDMGDLCNYGSAPAWRLFWKTVPGIWRGRCSCEHRRFSEICRDLWKAFPCRRTALCSGGF